MPVLLLSFTLAVNSIQLNLDRTLPSVDGKPVGKDAKGEHFVASAFAIDQDGALIKHFGNIKAYVK